MSDNALTADQLSNILLKMSYQAEVVADGKAVRSGASGFKFTIIPLVNAAEFMSAVIWEHKPVNPEMINSFNKINRFGKVYADDDGDVVLISDFLLNYDDSNEKLENLMQQIMIIWEGLIGKMKDHLMTWSDIADATPENP